MKLLSFCLTASLLLIGGCVPTFDHVVTPTTKEKVDLSPYVGVWKLTKIFGQAPGKKSGEQLFLSAHKEGVHLKVIMAANQDFSHPKKSDVTYFQLIQLGKHTVAFGSDDGRNWHVSRFVFKQNQKQLSIEGLDQSQLEREIKGGTLKGNVYDEAIRQTWIQVTASAPEVRKYLIQRAQFGEAFVLTRIMQKSSLVAATH